MRTLSITVAALVVLLLACGSSDPPVELAAAPGTSPGEQVSRMHCVLCHGKDGRLGFNGAKDLAQSTLSKAEMVAQVTEGKGTMVPYKNVLTAKEIDAVVAHVRGLPKAQ